MRQGRNRIFIRITGGILLALALILRSEMLIARDVFCGILNQYGDHLGTNTWAKILQKGEFENDTSPKGSTGSEGIYDFPDTPLQIKLFLNYKDMGNEVGKFGEGFISIQGQTAFITTAYRGESRFVHNSVKPLEAELDKTSKTNSVFRSFHANGKKFDIVTHSRGSSLSPSDRANQAVLKEFIIHRLANFFFGKASLGVRLAEISYYDVRTNKLVYKGYGIIRESKKNLANRLGVDKLKKQNRVASKEFEIADYISFAEMEIFQKLIVNWDYGYIDRTDRPLQNLVGLGEMGEDGSNAKLKYFIPYDFDHSTLGLTDQAGPVSKFQDRMSWGLNQYISHLSDNELENLVPQVQKQDSPFWKRLMFIPGRFLSQEDQARQLISHFKLHESTRNLFLKNLIEGFKNIEEAWKAALNETTVRAIVIKEVSRRLAESNDIYTSRKFAVMLFKLVKSAEDLSSLSSQLNLTPDLVKLGEGQDSLQNFYKRFDQGITNLLSQIPPGTKAEIDVKAVNLFRTISLALNDAQFIQIQEKILKFDCESSPLNIPRLSAIEIDKLNSSQLRSMVNIIRTSIQFIGRDLRVDEFLESAHSTVARLSEHEKDQIISQIFEAANSSDEIAAFIRNPEAHSWLHDEKRSERINKLQIKLDKIQMMGRAIDLKLVSALSDKMNNSDMAVRYAVGILTSFESKEKFRSAIRALQANLAHSDGKVFNEIINTLRSRKTQMTRTN